MYGNRVTDEHFEYAEIERAVDRILRERDSASRTEKELSAMAYRLLKNKTGNSVTPPKSQSKGKKAKAEISVQDLLASVTIISPPDEKNLR